MQFSGFRSARRGDADAGPDEGTGRGGDEDCPGAGRVRDVRGWNRLRLERGGSVACRDAENAVDLREINRRTARRGAHADRRAAAFHARDLRLDRNRVVRGSRRGEGSGVTVNVRRFIINQKEIVFFYLRLI